MSEGCSDIMYVMILMVPFLTFNHANVYLDLRWTLFTFWTSLEALLRLHDIIRSLLMNLTSKIAMETNRSRFAAIKHNSIAIKIFDLDDLSSAEEVKELLLDEWNYTSGGGSSYYKALDLALNDIMMISARATAKKFVIGLTDGLDSNTVSAATKGLVKMAKDNNIQVITIGMGKDFPEASTPGHNVSVNSSEMLPSIFPDVFDMICTDDKEVFSNVSECECNPNCGTGHNMQELMTKIAEITKVLKIDLNTLSKTRRKKTSAQDERLSSALIGYCSASVLIVVGAWIVVPDAMTFLTWIIRQSGQTKGINIFLRRK